MSPDISQMQRLMLLRGGRALADGLAALASGDTAEAVECLDLAAAYSREASGDDRQPVATRKLCA
jgi:hypothetical protein